MADTISATPLISLDAVVLDIETTGLNPSAARVVEIGCVRLSAGRLDSATLRALVDPQQPIPESSARIHGIDAQKLRGAPPFPSIWPKVADFLAGLPVIGHTIDFDLAIFAAECERAGLPFRIPRALDIRWLGELAKPDLADHSLEGLAAWLKLPVENRHSALGDALTAARIFLALVPLLRERGIRTFAEAETASRERSHADAMRRGLHPSLNTPESEAALAGIDSYPYRHRVRDLMSAPPVFVGPGEKLGAVIDLLAARRISSAFVAPAGRAESGPFVAADCGIITERDCMRAIADNGAAALERAVGAIANRPLISIPSESFIYRAIARMSRLKIRHLGVTDAAGRVVGALSARDLLRLRAEEAVQLGDEIDEAADVHELGRAWARLPAAAGALLAEGVDARTIAAVISSELRALTGRAAQIGERRMQADGLGPAPVPYAVLVLGSAGRGESLLAMDQDNAIVFAEGEPDGPEDRWFAQLGTHVADLLHAVGVPYCKGGVMAKNAAFRGSLAVWRARVREWISRSRAEDLLSVDIFFDFRSVYGDGELASELWRDAYDLARGEVAFVKLLAESAGPFVPPIGLFGVRTENGRVDLKRGGLFGIVAAARVLAIRHHVAEHSTKARLEGIKALKIGLESDLDTLIEAHGELLHAILEQQLIDVGAGRSPSNRVEWRRQPRRRQQRLKRALQSLEYADQIVRDLITAGSQSPAPRYGKGG